MTSHSIGKLYDVVHARKGRFTIRVTQIAGSLITGLITKGTAYYISENNRLPGDSITLEPNGPLCSVFREVAETCEPANKNVAVSNRKQDVAK